MRFFTFCLLFFNLCSGHVFVEDISELKRYKNRKDVIMVCSPGRSGSTLLCYTLDASHKSIIKSHLLPPKNGWNGKIVFIFSNPDLAAESVFHLSLTEPKFIYNHFQNVETSDEHWLRNLENIVDNDGVQLKCHQSLKNNLLSYDALGTKEQLRQWLITGVEKVPMEESCVLAIKYENLWDNEVIEAIKEFCEIEVFSLPKRKSRGYKSRLSPNEQLVRSTYNLGTESDPHYGAYVSARAIWEKAPKFQTYKLKQ